MRTIGAALVRWLAATAPPERLAVLRIVTGVFALAYLLARLPVFLALADRDPAALDPVGALWWLSEPLPDAVVVGAVIALLVAAAAYTVGIGFRWTGPVFAVLLLAITTYRSSWGQLLWFENLVVLHVLIVAVSPAADALSFDARRVRARTAPGTETPTDRTGSVSYGWPVRIAAIVTVASYVLAGVAKLRIGGLEWMAGNTLRNHVAYSATRLDVLGGTSSPLAAPFVDRAWLSSPVAIATIVMEVGAPVALLGGRWRTGWVIAAWAFHAGVAALMFVVFPYPLALVAFAPLFRLERLAIAVRSLWQRRPHRHRALGA